MIIKPDSMVIEDSDVQQLSSGLQEALLGHVLPGQKAVSELNRALAQVIRAAKQKQATRLLNGLGPLMDALAIADDTKAAEVKAIIDQAKDALGVAKLVGGK